ncbi:MAG: hypothetical protein AAF641_01910 [Pseudomonadota bacterium]
MTYISQNPSNIGAFLARVLHAVASTPDRIVEDRQRAALRLLDKSDDELAQMGLSRAHVKEDVHRHLYYC